MTKSRKNPPGNALPRNRTGPDAAVWLDERAASQRDLAPGPDLKVLFITGYAENAVVGNGHLEPGMQVLTKPFAMETLAKRIKSMVEG